MSHLDEGTLAALLDGEIPSDELRFVTAHLEGCEGCRTLLEELRQLAAEADTLVQSLGDGAPMNRVVGGVVPIASRTRIGTLRRLAWAATVVIAAGLGYWAGLPGESAPAILAEGGATETAASAESSRLDPAADHTGPETAQPERTAPSAPDRRQVTTTAEPPAAVRPADAVTGDAAATLGRVAGRADLERAKAADALAGARAELAPRAAAPLAAPAPPAERRSAAANLQEVAVESFTPIAFVEAVARMGGTLRLVDGLVPDRLEASARTVRVIYPLATGELVLEQRRIGDSIDVALRGPLSSDSLAVLRGRVR